MADPSLRVRFTPVGTDTSSMDRTRPGRRRAEVHWSCRLLVVSVAVLGCCGHGLAYQEHDAIARTVPVSHEYCQWEVFNASCPGPNEIVLITSARYGRMKVGRCIPVDYYVGCSANVIDQVEQRCSGRSSCTISVPDAELFRLQPCRKDLVAYFEAAYRCVTVSGVSSVNNNNNTTATCKDGVPITVNVTPFGYLASPAASRVSSSSVAAPGSSRCPWLLQAPAGQRINVTLMDFTSPATNSALQDVKALRVPASPAAGSASGATWCPVVVQFREDAGDHHPLTTSAGSAPQRETIVRSCDSRVRKRVVYVSRSNRLKVVMPLSSAVADTDMDVMVGHYVIYFEVSGCADLAAPEHAWLQRKGDTLQVACNHTAERWHLVCKGNDWVGTFGNCSAPIVHSRTGLGGAGHPGGTGGARNVQPGQTSAEEAHGVHLQQFPFGLLVAIAIGAVVGIVVGCIFLLTVFTFRKRLNHSERVLTSADYDPSTTGGTVLLHDHMDHTTIYTSSRENAYKTPAELRSAGGHHILPPDMTTTSNGTLDYTGPRGPPRSAATLYSTAGYPRIWDAGVAQADGCPSCGGDDSGCGDDDSAGRCGCGREMIAISGVSGGGQPVPGPPPPHGPDGVDDDVCFTEELVRRKLLFGRCPGPVLPADEQYLAATGRRGPGTSGPNELAMRTFRAPSPSARQATSTTTGGAAAGTYSGTLRVGGAQDTSGHVCGAP